MQSNIFKLSAVLLIVCAAVTFMLALTNYLTKDRIANTILQAEISARQEALSSAESFEKITSDGKSEIYKGLRNGETVGYTVSVAPAGYGGAIKMIVGLDKDYKVKGINFVEMSETPGLGTKVKDDKFKNQYIGKTGVLEAIKGGTPNDSQVSAISGATISSRAVTEGVNIAIKEAKAAGGKQ